MFQQIEDLRPIYSDFRMLRDYSRGARYDLQKFSASEVEDLVRNELSAVRQHRLAVSQAS